jgi:N-acetylmuramoyl-L-alanine amidase
MSLSSFSAQRLPGLLLLIGLGLGLALATGEAGASTQVAGIRHWSGPDHTRVVLDLSAAPVFKQKITADPPRVVIDLSQARFSQGVRPFKIRDGLVEEVRIISPPRGPAQLVLELKRPAPVKVFTLGPGGGKPHRLVIDVLHKGEAKSAAAKGASSSAAKSPKPRRDWVVVVDPGHGGRDPGAKGIGGVWEKDICLAIGRALATDLNRRPGIKAYLTRDRDIYLSLRRRTRVAAEKQADIFVSIHTNSNHDRKARGTEVYFLSLRGASDEAAREVAMRENAADHVEGVPTESQDEIEDILVDLMRTAALERSSDLAATLINHLRSDKNLLLRGVKQAGFDVLKTAGMPSVLVETAFISHETEVKLLKNKRFQQRFATLVGSGVASYLDRAAAASEAPAASQAPATSRGAAAATSGAAGS